MSNSTCIPAQSEVRTRKANMLGMALSMLVYGAHVAFFATIVKHFVRVRHSSSRRHIWSFVCTACVFVLATLGITLQFVCDDYIFYGDAPSYDVEEPFMAYTPQYKLSTAVTVLYLSLQWFSDALMLWRCSAMYQYTPMIWIPCTVVLVGLIALGSCTVHDLTSLGMPWASKTKAPSLAYIAVVLAYNLILTGLMMALIVKAFRDTMQFCTTRDSRYLYTSIIGTMCVSAALYTIVNVITLASIAMDASFTSVLLPLLGQMQAIPSQLLTVNAATERDEALRRSAPTLSSLYFDANCALEKADAQPFVRSGPPSRRMSELSVQMHFPHSLAVSNQKPRLSLDLWRSESGNSRHPGLQTISLGRIETGRHRTSFEHSLDTPASDRSSDTLCDEPNSTTSLLPCLPQPVLTK